MRATRRRKRYFKKCRICGHKSSSEVCQLCQDTITQIKMILKHFEEGSVPQWLNNAMVEFDRIYYANTQLRVFYNSACEAVMAALDSFENEFDLVEPDFSSIPRNTIITVLVETGIVKRKEAMLIRGEYLDKILRLHVSGYEVSSKEFQNAIRLIYAIVTLRLAVYLLDQGTFTPQIILGIFRAFSSHISRHLDNEPIRDRITSHDFEKSLRKMAARTKAHVEWDLLGLTAITGPRIFEDVNAEKGELIFKPSIIRYMEYIRERLREIPRTREL